MIDFSKRLWFGREEAGNRWWDKPLQWTVFKNGEAGFAGEHSCMDGQSSPFHVLIRYQVSPELTRSELFTKRYTNGKAQRFLDEATPHEQTFPFPSFLDDLDSNAYSTSVLARLRSPHAHQGRRGRIREARRTLRRLLPQLRSVWKGRDQEHEVFSRWMVSILVLGVER